MTTDRRVLVARSIAALDDQASIESRSLEAITADLAKLGIDPKASIMAARKRASERSTPAERLLARLDDGEAIDAEIEALENADLGDIQSNTPTDIAATAIARAKQQAGLPTRAGPPTQPGLPANVTTLKRPGRRYWGWGSSIVGIAACLLLFVMTRPDLLDQFERTASETVDEVGVFSEEVTVALPPTPMDDIETSVSSADRQTAAFSRRKERASLSEAASAVTAEEEVKRPAPAKDQAPPVTAAATVLELSLLPETRPVTTLGGSSTKQEPVPDQETAALAKAPLVPSETSGGSNLAARAENPGVIRNALTDLPPENLDFGPSIEGQSGLKAILIVDQNKAPLALKLQARILPKGDLNYRLDEAQTLLGNRPVLALVTRLRDGNEVDTAVTTRTRPALAKAENALNDNVLSSKGQQNGFDLIDLPDIPDR